MTPAEFKLEKTKIGMQYVIPGTERPAKTKRCEYSSENDQLVIPGAERISTADHLARLAEQPITPRRCQVGLQGTGLFGAIS